MLDFTMDPQRGDSWCWAAVSSCVTKYFAHIGSGAALEQCQVASRILADPPPVIERTDCCIRAGGRSVADCPGRNPVYDVEANLNGVLDTLGHLETPIDGWSDFPTIQTQITGSGGQPPSPVCIRFSYDAGDAHYIVIVDAYLDASGTPTYSVVDPLNVVPAPTSAESLQSLYRSKSGTWTNTYLTR